MASIQRAVEDEPVLARLGERVHLTQRMLACIQSTLPLGLKSVVVAGPLEDSTWCLLLKHNTGASKVRQLSPILLQRLIAEGYPVTQLRIKVAHQG